MKLIDTLGAALRRSLGRGDLVLRPGWRMTPMATSLGSATGGVYRLEGEAGPGPRAEPLAWALVLKVLDPGPTGAEQGDHDYWAREAMVYRSRLLEDLPEGMGAPRCHGVDSRPDGSLWVWLEVLPELAWSLDDYRRVARDLGRFNGAYLTGRPLPDAPWLSRNWVRDFRALWAHARNAQLVRDPAAWAVPRLRARVPASMQERVLRMWEQSEALCDALDRLPRTFCHRDAHRQNLFGRRPTETVAVDWAYAGDGAVGEEIVPLVISSLWYGQVPPSEGAALSATVWAGYLQGLREVGWQDDERLARLGYAAGAVARWDFFPGQLVGMAQNASADESVLASRAATSYLLLDLAEEAGQLVKMLG